MLAQNLVLVALAIFPSVFLANYVYDHDTVDAEPPRLLWSLVALGALAGLPASILEVLGDEILLRYLPYGTVLYYFLDSFLVVGIAEEGCKYLMLRLRTWRHPAFDYRFDGVVYGVMVAVGFATLENLMYVLQNGIETGIARAVLSVPGHVAWGVVMGYYYGQAKAFDVMGNRTAYKANIRKAFWIPALAHGLYDTCAFINGPLLLVLLVFAGAMDIVMVRLVRSGSAHDQAIFQQPAMASGFAAYGQYQMPAQPQAAPAASVPPAAPTAPGKPFSVGAFVVKRALAYLGVFAIFFVTAVVIDMVAGEGPGYRFLIGVLGIMLIMTVPFLVIEFFAGRMRARRMGR